MEAWYTSALDIEDVLAGAADSDIHLHLVKWEESSMVTKVPLTESRRLLVIMESPS